MTATLVSALVISRLDYGNVVLAGLPQSSTAPLQRVLNSAARLVCGLRPRDHVTEALFNLHTVYKSFNGIAPSYINDMLQPVATLQRQVTVRSVTNNDLVVPRARLRFGERAFSVAAPRQQSAC